jgi:hypothetical protein
VQRLLARLPFLGGVGQNESLQAVSLARLDTSRGVWLNGKWHRYRDADAELLYLLVTRHPRGAGHYVARSGSGLAADLTTELTANLPNYPDHFLLLVARDGDLTDLIALLYAEWGVALSSNGHAALACYHGMTTGDARVKTLTDATTMSVWLFDDLLGD